MNIKIVITIAFCLLTFLVRSQNIVIKKINGLYKAVNLNIANDSINYIPCGKFKPILLNDSSFIMFSPFAEAPTSIYQFIFNKKGKFKKSFYSARIKFPERLYYLRGDKKGKKLIYRVYYDIPNNRNDKKIVVIKEKYMNNPDEIVKSVCEKINALKIDGLSCNVVVEKK